MYSERGLNADAFAFHLAVLAALELPVRAATGDLPKALLSRGFSLLAIRRGLSASGFLIHGAAAAVAAVGFAGGLPIAGVTAALAVSEASQALHSGGYYSNYLDLTQEYAGALSGFGNTLATGLGSIGTLFMPVIIYIRIR